MSLDSSNGKNGFFKAKNTEPFGLTKAENVSAEVVDGIKSTTTYSGITHTHVIGDDTDGGDAVD